VPRKIEGSAFPKLLSIDWFWKCRSLVDERVTDPSEGHKVGTVVASGEQQVLGSER
jgi:hypothetical protein